MTSLTCDAIEVKPYSDADTTEAAQLFGELEDGLDTELFSAWITTRSDRQFQAISGALDTLRRAIAEYHADRDRDYDEAYTDRLLLDRVLAQLD